MAQGNMSSVQSPHSVKFMRSLPLPPGSCQSGWTHVKTLRPPPPPSLLMSPAQVNQWIPARWIPSAGPMGRMTPMRSSRPARHIRPGKPLRVRRPVVPTTPAVGPRMWRGNHFIRRGNNCFHPMRKNPHINQNLQHKSDQQQSNNINGSADDSKTNAISSDASEKPNVKLEPSNEEVEKMIRLGRKRRKSISKFYPAKPWNRQDAEKALKVELEAYKKQVNTLLIKFPDPDLSWDMVRSYHSAIEKVHFHVPTGPRYCFIKLSDDSDVDQVMNDLKDVEFHNLGKIKVEKKCEKPEGSMDPESIDPYTLYVGNLPLTVNPSKVKEKFPTATRIDVGYAQKMKFTRYAFVRYQTVEESIEAFKSSHNVTFDSRSLIVRFRRQNGERSLSSELGTKSVRREKRKMIQRKHHMDDLKRIVEKKIKTEVIDKNDEECELRSLNDIIGSDVNMDDDQESEEEEKEVDDDDEDDDDDDDDDGVLDYIENWKPENIKEEEEEEEDEDDDEDEDEEEEEDEEDDDDEDEGEGGLGSFEH